MDRDFFLRPFLFGGVGAFVGGNGGDVNVSSGAAGVGTVGGDALEGGDPHGSGGGGPCDPVEVVADALDIGNISSCNCRS